MRAGTWCRVVASGERVRTVAEVDGVDGRRWLVVHQHGADQHGRRATSYRYVDELREAVG